MSAPTPAKADLAAIFAGGAARRMGGVDKAAVMLGGEPLYRIVARRLAPQANALAVLSSNRPAWLAQLPEALWIADDPEAKGPAGGLIAALHRLKAEQGDDALLLTAPADAPFMPADLFERLETERSGASAPAAIVRHAGGLHPVFGLWRAACAGPVAEAARTERALHRIAAKAGAIACEAWARTAPDPFMNLNTPEDVAAAQALLGR